MSVPVDEMLPVAPGEDRRPFHGRISSPQRGSVCSPVAQAGTARKSLLIPIGGVTLILLLGKLAGVGEKVVVAHYLGTSGEARRVLRSVRCGLVRGIRRARADPAGPVAGVCAGGPDGSARGPWIAHRCESDADCGGYIGGRVPCGMARGGR